MRLHFLYAAVAACTSICAGQSTAGIRGLLQRRLPSHADRFSFTLTDLSNASTSTKVTAKSIDEYSVSNGADGKIHISGSTPSALAYGLRYYLSTYLKVDIYWFIGSQLHLASNDLPRLESTHNGSSVVPWRYHFNTVTFSYTAPFWEWEDWETQLDWMALHGINLPLAWVGYEKILVDVLLEYGFKQSDIIAFLSGPAFQAWNRFGNIQGSWGGELSMSWIDSQFTLQKKIVARMVELGMTPVLPSFTGFVPRQIDQVYPNASFVNGSQWAGFPRQYTNVTFLEPFDPLFAKMQKSFIRKQIDAYGHVTNIYTLDQYNENTPLSGDLDYLRNVSRSVIASLKDADSEAVWMLQGWLFFELEEFWTGERVEAYLGAVENSEMLILDLFSESKPQWQRTDSYFGKPWIWCELHDYGGTMGLYGQIDNVTINPIEALNNQTSTMIGMGLTMEGQEGNQIIYDVLLDQAWSSTPLPPKSYFQQWTETRYHSARLPSGISSAWDLMRSTVYNNTDSAAALSVPRSIFVLQPNTTGLLNITGLMPAKVTYNPEVLVLAWSSFYNASKDDPTLWDNEAYTFDLTDITRQVMGNAFYSLYTEFIQAANHSLKSYSESTARTTGNKLIQLLNDLDTVLAASNNAHWSLPAWLASAYAWAPSSTNSSTNATALLEYDARNQVTLWGPTGQISGYASKEWAGLVRTYYVPRWQMFIDYTLNSTTSADGQNAALSVALLDFELSWQHGTTEETYDPPSSGELKRAIAGAVKSWPSVFGM